MLVLLFLLISRLNDRLVLRIFHSKVFSSVSLYSWCPATINIFPSLQKSFRKLFKENIQGWRLNLNSWYCHFKRNSSRLHNLILCGQNQLRSFWRTTLNQNYKFISQSLFWIQAIFFFKSVVSPLRQYLNSTINNF